MSSESPSDPSPQAPAPEPKQPWLSPSRIVVIVFVLVGLAIIGWELYARLSWQASCNAVEARMGKLDIRGATIDLPKKDLASFLHGVYSRQPNGETGEVFVWQGVLRKYPMYVTYSEGEVVQRMSTEND